MKKVPLEILFRLDEKITNLPNNGKLRRELVHEVAILYDLSDSAIYRQLKNLQLHPPTRKRRKDSGAPKILSNEKLYLYCQLIAALKIRTINNQNHTLSTKQCITFLENEGVVVNNKTISAPKNILKTSTVNKYLSLYYISPNDVLSEPTFTHFEASYSNQCWQLDITPSELHRLPSQHKDDPRRVFVFSVIDDKSGLSYSRYYLAEGEDTLTSLDFLYNAFAKLTNNKNELHGLPTFIYTDNASFVKSALFNRVMSKLGIQILTHLPRGKGGRKTTARAKGKIERHHRSIKSILEPIYKFSVPHDLYEANIKLTQFSLELSHKKHRSLNKNRSDVWLEFLPIDAKMSICPYAQYQSLLREPVSRKVKGDATVQINSITYQVESQFAGEEVIVLASLEYDHIYIEYRNDEYGPFLPSEAPLPFGEYKSPTKSLKEKSADEIVMLSKVIQLNLPANESQGSHSPYNLNPNLLPPHNKEYLSITEAKLAIAKYIGKPLGQLLKEQQEFINQLTSQTLKHDELIQNIDNYLKIKIISNKEMS